MGFLEEQEKSSKQFSSNAFMSDPDNSSCVIQSELEKDETLLWSGKANSKNIFSKCTLTICFVFISFVIFEFFTFGMIINQRLNLGIFGVFFVIFSLLPFITITAAYMNVRRGVFNTVYGVTNKRIIILRNSKRRQVKSYIYNKIPFLEKNVGKYGIGTIKFGNEPVTLTNLSNRTAILNNPFNLDLINTPSLVEISNVEQVYDIISYQIKQHTSGNSSS